METNLYGVIRDGRIWFIYLTGCIHTDIHLRTLFRIQLTDGGPVAWLFLYFDFFTSLRSLVMVCQTCNITIFVDHNNWVFANKILDPNIIFVFFLRIFSTNSFVAFNKTHWIVAVFQNYYSITTQVVPFFYPQSSVAYHKHVYIVVWM